MPKRLKAIPISEFPSVSTNCLGFAIGNTIPVRESEDLYVLNHKRTISEAFFEKLTELGYEHPRQINSVEDAYSNEFILMVFDFSEYHRKHMFMGWETHWNYHVARRELDGSWVHKPGWDEPPCEIHSESDWEEIFNEFGRKYVLFAFAD